MSFAVVAAVLSLQAVAQIDIPPRPPAPLETVPHLTVLSYLIQGYSANELHASMDELGPLMANDVRAVARTQWRNTVRWTNNAQGCMPETTELSWQIETLVPEIAPEAKAGPRLRERFARYRLQLDAFEYERAQRVNAGMEAMLISMRSAKDCDGLNAARQAGEAAIQAANRDYDAATARARRGIRPLS